MENDIQRINDYYQKITAKLYELKDILVTYVDLPDDEISEHHNEISDAILFIILLKIDISIGSKHLLVSKENNNAYEMNYFSRALVIQCSDIANTDKPGRLLNKIEQIAELYKNKDDYKQLGIALYALRTKIISVGTDNKQFLGDIRNNLFAHRDGKGIVQHGNINDIDTARVAGITEDIDNLLHEMIGVLLDIQKILAPLNTTESLKAVL